MPRNKALEVEKDAELLDRALERVTALIDSGDPALVVPGAKSLVLLLERKAQLLGLDAQPGAETKSESQPVARILAAVPKANGSG